jgi:hypothetical protein
MPAFKQPETPNDQGPNKDEERKSPDGEENVSRRFYQTHMSTFQKIVAEGLPEEKTIAVGHEEPNIIDLRASRENESYHELLKVLTR